MTQLFRQWRRKSQPWGDVKAGHVYERAGNQREGVARAVVSGTRCGSLLGLSGISGPALREPEALAIHLEDVAVEGQTIQQSAGYSLGSEG